MMWIEQHQEVLRQIAVFGVIAVVVVWEFVAMRRPQQLRPSARWTHNALLLVVWIGLARLLRPVGAVAVASIAIDAGWGLLNWLNAPLPVEIVLAVLALDFFGYCWHRLYHHVPVLWRLHRVHHSDVDVDFTTGARHHPLIALPAVVLHIAAILALGPAVVAVILFEVLDTAQEWLQHANARTPRWLDRLVRPVLITPDMHRVHHSARQAETDSNFGGVFSFWDRLFGTYRAQPRDGHDGMTLGLEAFREPRDHRIDRLLTQPFATPAPNAQTTEPTIPTLP